MGRGIQAVCDRGWPGPHGHQGRRSTSPMQLRVGSAVTPHPSPSPGPPLTSVSTDLPLLDSSMHRITQYMSFYACLCSLSVMFSRLISVGANVVGHLSFFVSE